MGEYLIYSVVRFFGSIIRLLPIDAALAVGRMMGLAGYYFNVHRRALVYSNLKTAFTKDKTSQELKEITKSLFKNFGQNLIEVFFLPQINSSNSLEKFVRIEGREHVYEALKEGKGVILLAMHFGSWEIASLASSMLGRPYKVIVKSQTKFSKLDELLNSYRGCAGSGVIVRGLGTREIIKSLKNNELIGMVVDQGGKEGELVPFFGRHASMSSGAIRLGLKMGIPICFSIIAREQGAHHRLVINKPFELESSGDLERDIITNLTKITQVMENYVRDYPAEYMWFYKIWKYSSQATTIILSDGKTGHLRQSQILSKMVEVALAERGIKCKTEVLKVEYKNSRAGQIVSFLSLLTNSFIVQGRMQFLKRFVSEESFKQVMSVKADFIISCGSSVAGLNYLLAQDQQAKSISVLKPGMLSFRKFDLVVLPQHDYPANSRFKDRLVVTQGAPNLITPQYLKEKSELLLTRFSHLKMSKKPKIGLLLGGDSRDYVLSEDVVKVVINQIKESSLEIGAEILVTTSRRTPARIENLVIRELRRYSRAPLVIIANRHPFEEVLGGILGLADTLVISGDSISMISEAASSRKNTIVFRMKRRPGAQLKFLKHDVFISKLTEQGFILSCEAQQLGRFIYDVAKNKRCTRPLDDQPTLLKAVREII